MLFRRSAVKVGCCSSGGSVGPAQYPQERAHPSHRCPLGELRGLRSWHLTLPLDSRFAPRSIKSRTMSSRFSRAADMSGVEPVCTTSMHQDPTPPAPVKAQSNTQVFLLVGRDDELSCQRQNSPATAMSGACIWHPSSLAHTVSSLNISTKGQQAVSCRHLATGSSDAERCCTLLRAPTNRGLWREQQGRLVRVSC